MGHFDSAVSLCQYVAHRVGHTVFGSTAAAPLGILNIAIPIVKPAGTAAKSDLTY